jgi:AcrR family transcriptional regulator
MSPRAYRSPVREAASSETRARILEAARSLLSQSGPAAFTIDAVATAADVARMTVYNQFGSKTGLVEALSDDLAVRGGIRRLPEAFTAEDAMTGLAILVEVFTSLWSRERALVRPLRALALLDPELARSNRDLRRRQALTVLIRRLASETGRPAPADQEAAIDLLLALTSFETYENLAQGRNEAAVAQILVYAARRLLGS